MKLALSRYSIFAVALMGFYGAWFLSHAVSWRDVYLENWPAALTMMFGSFVAGSTPLGGGAVSFPVFSKLLGASAIEARSFGFLIQSVGMSFATLLFVCLRIHINWRIVLLCVVGSASGLVIGLTLFANSDSMTKLAFSLFALLSGILLVKSRSRVASPDERHKKPAPQAIIGVGLLGGLLSSQVGAGADTIAFFYLVLFCGFDAKRTIPTSVAVMALTAILGALVTLGYQPDSLSPFVINAWLAAAPVVAIGAPLGGWVMSRLKPRTLIVFIKVVLMVEATSTLLFVELPPFAFILLLGAILGAGTLLVVLLREKEH
jgi:uncharacterized membrane protein YfcA